MFQEALENAIADSSDETQRLENTLAKRNAEMDAMLAHSQELEAQLQVKEVWLRGIAGIVNGMSICARGLSDQFAVSCV